MPFNVCAIFRNEAPYLREWIEFHRIVGAERFFLYQNNSDDDWKTALRPYLSRGIVHVIDWPMPSPSQLVAYQHFIEQGFVQEGWIAFIDCDEFIFSPRCPSLSELLARDPFRGFPAIGVNWCCFGASGQENRGQGLVIDRFTMRPRDPFETNSHVKTVVRIECVASVGLTPHDFKVDGGTYGEDADVISGAFRAPASHEWLRINHYKTKSRQEWLDRISSPRADAPVSREPAEFERYQSDLVLDSAITRFSPELKRRLAVLEPDPAAGVTNSPLE